MVDNASSDETLAVVREALPTARVIETGSNRGYAAGLNVGIAAAGRGAAVLVLNADVRLRPGSVPAMLRALDDPRVGIVAPRIGPPLSECSTTPHGSTLPSEHDRVNSAAARSASV